MKEPELSRRDFLRLAGVTSGGLVLAACGTRPTGTPAASPAVPRSTTSTPPPPLDSLPETLQAIAEFSRTLRAAGMEISAEQLYDKGLNSRVLRDLSGIEREVACVRLDTSIAIGSEGPAAEYPLMMRTGTSWERATLQSLAELRGWRFGALLNPIGPFVPITFNNFGIGTYYIDWNYVQAQEGVWDFSDPDYPINMAKGVGMPVTANLIWGKNRAEWVGRHPDPHKIMLDYIAKVMDHFRGKVGTWTAYNEANRADYDIFWRKMGLDAPRDAFAHARTTDPAATLLYSDFVDLEGYAMEDRLAIIKQVVPALIADGTLDGLAIQATGRYKRLNLEVLRSTLQRLTEFELPIHISEFSILIEGENTAENLRKQAAMGADVVRVLEAFPSVVDVTAWGLEDRITNKMYVPDANAGFWLLTEDGAYVPKPIVYEIMATLTESL